MTPGAKLKQLWDARIAEITRERDEARGAMRADDERLRVAAARVGIVAGCDAPDLMADEIERLRTAWTAIDRANGKLMERVEAAERERDEAKRILSLAVGREEETLAFIISNRDDTIRKLQERLAATEARDDELEASVNILQSWNSDLTARLATAEAAYDTTSQQVSNLVLLVGRLVQQVRKHDETNDVAEKAMDYLRRKELMPSIVRGVGAFQAAKAGGV